MRKYVLLAALLASACGAESPTTPNTPNIAGNYSVQFNASSSCSQLLPSAFRNRSYTTVVVTQSGQDVTMSITTSIGTLPMVLGSFGSSSQVSGALEVHDNNVNYHVTGTVQISASGNSLTTGTLNGAIFTGTANCIAANHQVVFQRR